MRSLQVLFATARNVDEAVRALLALRAVQLHPTNNMHKVHGFRCMGLAERVPELDEGPGSSVHVWHVHSALLPISPTEIERWSVDAPGGRHWILSERSFPEDILDSVDSSVDVVIWGPERMARWIGEAVLSGDLVAHSPDMESETGTEVSTSGVTEPIGPRRALKPLVDLDSWLVQRGWEEVNTTPVLMSAKLWIISGSLVGPEDERESAVWQVLEDPWSSSLAIYDPDEELDYPPRLRVVNPPEMSWTDIRELPPELLRLLDSRKQGEPDSNDGPVRSMMLEWWRFNSKTAEFTESPVTIPGWVIEVEGAPTQVLHGRNGRRYEYV